MRAVWYKKLYVFRVVSLNLERLRHKRSRLFDREERSVSLCQRLRPLESSSGGRTLLFALKENVRQKAAESLKKKTNTSSFPIYLEQSHWQCATGD